MSPPPFPLYVYKILPAPPPSAFPAELPLSELDQNDGFVHLSTAVQVPKTADLFFSDASALWVVKLGYEQFLKDIKWEGGFPHLYGNFGADHVQSVEKLEKLDGKSWADSLHGSTWLI